MTLGFSLRIDFQASLDRHRVGCGVEGRRAHDHITRRDLLAKRFKKLKCVAQADFAEAGHCVKRGLSGRLHFLAAERGVPVTSLQAIG